MIRFKPHREKDSHALAIILILVTLFFSISAFRGLFGVRQALLNVVYPFQYATNAIWNGVLAVPTSVVNLTRLNSENSQLKGAIKELKLKQLGFDQLQKENDNLRQALKFRRSSPYRYKLVAAQVIGRSPAPWFSIAQLDQGSGAGIKKGMPVVTVDGVVGRVIEVSKLTSKVALLIDPASSVAAQDFESGDFGVVVGRSSAKLAMKYVGVGGRIKVGDRVVTSTISRVYPPGIIIGKVTKAAKREHDLFYQIEIAPAVDLSKLSEVFVVIK